MYVVTVFVHVPVVVSSFLCFTPGTDLIGLAILWSTTSRCFASASTWEHRESLCVRSSSRRTYFSSASTRSAADFAMSCSSNLSIPFFLSLTTSPEPSTLTTLPSTQYRVLSILSLQRAYSSEDLIACHQCMLHIHLTLSTRKNTRSLAHPTAAEALRSCLIHRARLFERALSLSASLRLFAGFAFFLSIQTWHLSFFLLRRVSARYARYFVAC